MRVNIGELGIHDMYNYYKVRVKNPISFDRFKAIAYTTNKLVVDKVLEGDTVKLPYRMGYLRVRKTKMNYDYLKFDYGTYNKTGIKAVHLNMHSDDFKARILWDKSKCIVAGKRPYCFQPTRVNFKRRLSAIMKTPGGHSRYLEN